MSNNIIIQLPKKSTHHYISLANSFTHAHAIKKGLTNNVSYDNFVEENKGLLSQYFHTQNVETEIHTDTTHNAYGPTETLLAFKCTTKEHDELAQNMETIFAPVYR